MNSQPPESLLVVIRAALFWAELFASEVGRTVSSGCQTTSLFVYTDASKLIIKCKGEVVKFCLYGIKTIKNGTVPCKNPTCCCPKQLRGNALQASAVMKITLTPCGIPLSLKSRETSVTDFYLTCHRCLWASSSGCCDSPQPDWSAAPSAGGNKDTGSHKYILQTCSKLKALT